MLHMGLWFSQVDRHVGEALEAMRELEKHISLKKENKAKVSRPSKCLCGSAYREHQSAIEKNGHWWHSTSDRVQKACEPPN